MNSKELMLGLILVKEGKLTKDQLKRSLLKQGEIRRFGRHQRLGEVIVKLGYMTQDDIDAVIEVQNMLMRHGADHTPLGLLIIEHGLASPGQVYDALVERQFKESRLGELLIEKGFFTELQLVPLLAQQEQERAAALAARLERGEPIEPASESEAPDDGFVIFDAGGESSVPLRLDTFAAVPKAAEGDLLFKSYLEE
ncbi:MAG: hypothetical protein JWM80_5705 [Cyanobacteria bacterium RYN_339]|nr:hypothetical protein [Cyanobacteria bacterium RYN_339]